MPTAEEPSIDWSLTTWEGAEREQLRRWAALSLADILRAQEKMQDLAHRLAVGNTIDAPPPVDDRA